MMVSRGWRGFEASWFDKERNGKPNGTGKGSIVEAGRRLTERLIAEQCERQLRSLDGLADGLRSQEVSQHQEDLSDSAAEE
jgi:hypothetical protein